MVLRNFVETEVGVQFSSPSGDGLVLFKDFKFKEKIIRPRVGMGWFLMAHVSITQDGLHFRPRLGLGWFRVPSLQSKRVLKFSSPLGDGVVPTTAEKRATNAPIFVPEWGWVGSWLRLHILKGSQ